MNQRPFKHQSTTLCAVRSNVYSVFEHLFSLLVILTTTLTEYYNSFRVEKNNELTAWLISREINWTSEAHSCCTVPLKGKLTVTRELQNSTRDSILDPRKFRESQLASWIFQVSSREKWWAYCLTDLSRNKLDKRSALLCCTCEKTASNSSSAKETE